MKAERKRRMIVVCALAIALLTISATSVFATHLFTDVSSSAFYHDDVDAIFNAGVTSGCGGAKYCPNNSVTRGQMAVFLDKLGALQLGAGGVPRTVVDALTDQGVLVVRFFRDVAMTNQGSSACSPVIELPFPADFGQYTLKFTLYDVQENVAEPAMETVKINVGVRDTDDAAPDEYNICLATTDGGDLSDGLYKLYGTMTVNLGQQLFGTGAGAAKAREAAENARSAANQ